MTESKLPEHVIAVGIGGTGAKCVEALAHLAVSGHAPQSIYPILIDQDSKNGNVRRCKNVLQAYSDLRKKTQGNRNWFFKSTLDTYDKLLPLLPQEESKNYGAAIGLPSMGEYEPIVSTLFLPSQLHESLDSGYKKRAHMGSLLIQQMLDREDEKTDKDIGLKFIISKVKTIPNTKVIIYGSLFGGTGASGLVRVGKYFKDHLKDAVVKGVFLTPYFIVGESSEEDKDASLVKSDADMQAVKIALQIYRDEINSSFHNVYIIGSELSKLDGECVTKEVKYGGEQQLNPSHVCELIAASIALSDDVQSQDKIFSFIADTELVVTPLRFSINTHYPKTTQNEFNAVLSDLKLKSKRIVIARDFASMLYKVRTHDDEAWWGRQPWVDKNYKSDLLNWGIRHYEWWREMSPEKWNDHIWQKFSLQLNTQIKEYYYTSLLSRHFKKSPSDLSNLFNTIDSLEKIHIRRLKWAST